MGCDIQRDKSGRVTKIICSRGPAPKKCRWCDNPGTQLCDFKVTGGTCDAPVCRVHAKHVAYETDYCPDHSR